MASGDKFYIADKVTLDEVKGKIGTTNDAGSGSTSTGSVFAKLNYLIAQLGSYLSNIYTYVSKIGVAADTGGTTSAGTIMAKLNFLLTNWTAARAGKVDTIDTNVSSLGANVGVTTDTGGTSTAGTVMAKENTILTKIGQIEEVLNLI